MPGTVALLVYCQNVQPSQPAGRGGLPSRNAAIHNWSAPNAALLPVQVLHQSAVV
jgi:hypothetical protein